eukprot:jgi/Orpsp1_1/1185674/evm.model.c7180000094812.1
MINDKQSLNCEAFEKLIECGENFKENYNAYSILIHAIKNRRIEYAKIILTKSSINVNQLYKRKTIMSTLIDDNVSDEKLFDLVFIKGGYIDSSYIFGGSDNTKSSLIEKNTGLIKSIIRNGLITMKNNNKEVLKINTPLIHFIKCRKERLVKKFLENGASIEETDDDGFTPIFHVIKNRNLKLFYFILNKYHPDITRKNKVGQTPLMYAQYLEKENGFNREFFIKALKKHIKYVKVHNLNHSSNQDMKHISNDNENKLNETILLLMDVIREGDYELAKIILDNSKRNNNKININYENSHHETPLTVLINNEHMENCELFNILLEYGADISKKFNGDTPLILSIKKKRTKYIKILLNMPSIDVNHLYGRKTIMSILIDNVVDDEEIFNILFMKGAYIDFSYITSSNNFYSFLIEKNTGLIKSIIHNGLITVKSKNSPVVKINTPLTYFIKCGKTPIIKKMLENNASVEETDEDGFTPLFHTIKGGRIDLFKTLLHKYNANTTRKDKMGNTPLDIALKYSKGNDQDLFVIELKKVSKITNPNNNGLNNNTESHKKEEEIHDTLLNLIKQKKISALKNILNNNNKIDINKPFNDNKTIMSIFIDNIIDNEEIYNILFKKGAFIDNQYILNKSNGLYNLIEKNQGLIKSIIQNGLITKNNENNQLKVIKSPLIYFIKSGQGNLAEKFLENGAPVEEVDENGLTPIFHSIKSCRINVFNLLLNKYNADINKKNNEGQTPL